jgi:hypothetical protein
MFVWNAVTFGLGLTRLWFCVVDRDGPAVVDAAADEDEVEDEVVVVEGEVCCDVKKAKGFFATDTKFRKEFKEFGNDDDDRFDDEFCAEAEVEAEAEEEGYVVNC